MLMQLNIPEKINDELKIYKVRNKLKNLHIAVIQILENKLGENKV